MGWFLEILYGSWVTHFFGINWRFVFLFNQELPSSKVEKKEHEMSFNPLCSFLLSQGWHNLPLQKQTHLLKINAWKTICFPFKHFWASTPLFLRGPFCKEKAIQPEIQVGWTAHQREAGRLVSSQGLDVVNWLVGFIGGLPCWGWWLLVQRRSGQNAGLPFLKRWCSDGSSKFLVSKFRLV